MSGKINLYSIGTHGVDLTKSIVHADDGTFRQLQNAVPDARGEFGGVAKRDGLVAINSSTAGGSVRGAITVSLPTTRNFYIARHDADWLTSTDELVSAVSTTALSDYMATTYFDSDPSGPFDDDPNIGLLLGGRIAWDGNRMIYPRGGYTQWNDLTGLDPSEAPPLMLWDGATERELVRVPRAGDVETAINLGAANSLLIYDMLLDGNKVYFSTYDGRTATPHAYARVMMLDLTTLEVTQLGATFITSNSDPAVRGIPMALCMAQGYLWAGVGIGTATITLFPYIYRMRPGVDSSWTSDFAPGSLIRSVLSIASYKGLMYAGLMSGATNAKGQLYVRSAAGVWTEARATTTVNTGARMSALCVYNDLLYFSEVELNGASSTSKIIKYDGTTFTAVHTFTNVSNVPQLGLNSFVHNGRIYFFMNTYDGANGRVAYSADGTTFTEVTTNMAAITGRVGLVVT